MKKVILHGRLGELFGEEWLLDVKTPMEAIYAIKANKPNFCNYLISKSNEGINYTFKIKDEFLKEEELCLKAAKNTSIHIVPAPEGSGFAAIGAALAAGAAAVGAALLNPWTWAMMIGGAALTYYMNKKSKPPRPEDPVSKASYVFKGGENIVGQGAFIPIGYGRLRVGSAVVSSSMTAYPTVQTTHKTELKTNILPLDVLSQEALETQVIAGQLSEALELANAIAASSISFEAAATPPQAFAVVIDNASEVKDASGNRLLVDTDGNRTQTWTNVLGVNMSKNTTTDVYEPDGSLHWTSAAQPENYRIQQSHTIGEAIPSTLPGNFIKSLDIVENESGEYDLVMGFEIGFYYEGQPFVIQLNAADGTVLYQSQLFEGGSTIPEE